MHSFFKFCIHSQILRLGYVSIYAFLFSSDSVSIFFVHYLYPKFIVILVHVHPYIFCVHPLYQYISFVHVLFTLMHQKFLFTVQCWFIYYLLYLYPILFKISDPFPELNKSRRWILKYIKLTTIFTTLKKYLQWLIVTAANILPQSLCSKNSNLLKFRPIFISIYSTIMKIRSKNFF